MTPLTAVLLACLLVCMSALLSAAETAVFAVSRSRLRTLVEEGFAGAEALAHIRGRSTSIQTAVHLLITILNLVAVGLATAGGALIRGATGALVALSIAVAGLIILAEIVPRAVAFRYPIRMALAAAPALARIERWVGAVLSPFIRMEALLSGLHGEEDDFEEREMRDMTDIGRREGIVDNAEHNLVERAFRLDERTAVDAMTPRVDVFALPEALTVAEVVARMEGVPYSRVPLHGESIDEITGVLHVREIYQSLISGSAATPARTLARAPWFVPGSLPLSELLRGFQARRLHMAIVADEFGGTDGVITLEDVLEELVGEIVDETDVDEEELLQIGDDDLVADGQVELRDINELFDLELPDGNRSLNGFILDEFGYVPQPGEMLEADGARVEVLEASETQVIRARLTRLEPGAVERED